MRARDDIAGERIFIRDKQCKQLGAMGNKQKAKGKGQTITNFEVHDDLHIAFCLLPFALCLLE